MSEMGRIGSAARPIAEEQRREAHEHQPEPYRKSELQRRPDLKVVEQAHGEHAPMPLARPTPLVVLSPQARKASAPLSYAEMKAQLAPVIEVQLKALEGIHQPATVFDVDVTGHEVQVCLACGRIGHDYRPTMVRQDNPEINMLSEFFVVGNEIAKRRGKPYGWIVHDEEVLVLRPVAAPGEGEDDEIVLRRFEAFLKRHDIKTIKDGTIMQWMAAEMAKWNPADATRKLVGEPADRRAIDTAQKLFADSGHQGSKGLIVAKGQPSKAGLRSLEAISNSNGIKVTGIAVGKQAQNVARTMFGKTLIAPDMHDLKMNVGAAIAAVAQ
jgi:hypothetical protein